MLAILFYDVVLTVHIFAVILAFGVTFAYPFMAVAAQGGHLGDLAAMHRFQVFLTRRLITPAMVVVLVAGLYLALDRWELSDPWISATFAILIVLFGMVGAVFAPAERRMAELAERDGAGAPSEEYQRLVRRMNVAGPLAGVLILTAVFLMTAKPGA